MIVCFIARKRKHLRALYRCERFSEMEASTLRLDGFLGWLDLPTEPYILPVYTPTGRARYPGLMLVPRPAPPFPVRPMVRAE